MCCGLFRFDGLMLKTFFSLETCFGNDQRKKNKEKLYKVESKKIRHI
jgi:hypothetical protein